MKGRVRETRREREREEEVHVCVWLHKERKAPLHLG